MPGLAIFKMDQIKPLFGWFFLFPHMINVSEFGLLNESFEFSILFCYII